MTDDDSVRIVLRVTRELFNELKIGVMMSGPAYLRLEGDQLVIESITPESDNGDH